MDADCDTSTTRCTVSRVEGLPVRLLFVFPLLFFADFKRGRVVAATPSIAGTRGGGGSDARVGLVLLVLIVEAGRATDLDRPRVPDASAFLVPVSNDEPILGGMFFRRAGAFLKMEDENDDGDDDVDARDFGEERSPRLELSPEPRESRIRVSVG